MRHTASGDGGWFAVEITWTAAAVRVAIADGGALGGPRVVDDPLREDGRGLLLVHGLCSRFGVCGDQRGRLVWADVPWDRDGAALPISGALANETVPATAFLAWDLLGRVLDLASPGAVASGHVADGSAIPVICREDGPGDYTPRPASDKGPLVAGEYAPGLCAGLMPYPAGPAAAPAALPAGFGRRRCRSGSEPSGVG